MGGGLGTRAVLSTRRGGKRGGVNLAGIELCCLPSRSFPPPPLPGTLGSASCTGQKVSCVTSPVNTSVWPNIVDSGVAKAVRRTSAQSRPARPTSWAKLFSPADLIGG